MDFVPLPGEFNFFVVMRSMGNPDHAQDPKKPISPSVIHEVGSLTGAATCCLEYIRHWDLGGGNWNGGQVFRNGKSYAYISYNGRVWKPDGKTPMVEKILA